MPSSRGATTFTANAHHLPEEQSGQHVHIIFIGMILGHQWITICGPSSFYELQNRVMRTHFLEAANDAVYLWLKRVKRQNLYGLRDDNFYKCV